MSKKSNVHPDHYKTAGRVPQGQDVVQESERKKMAEQRAEERHQREQQERAQEIEEGHQESTKEGKRSSAKKADGTRYESGPIPAAKPVAGAHGKEPAHGSDERGQDNKEAKRKGA